MRSSLRACGLAAILAGAVASACAHKPASAADVTIDCTITPDPPVTGLAEVDVVLTDAKHAPVKGAHVRVEGNMNHAGMVPSMANAAELDGGHYRAGLELTMGGDWVVTVEATLSDGRTAETTLPLRGVRAR